MRALGIVMAAVAFLVSAPADGAAQTDLSGTWDLTVMTDQGDEKLTLDIVQEGQDLTATGFRSEFGVIEMKGTLDGAHSSLRVRAGPPRNSVGNRFSWAPSLMAQFPEQQTSEAWARVNWVAKRAED